MQLFVQNQHPNAENLGVPLMGFVKLYISGSVVFVAVIASPYAWIYMHIWVSVSPEDDMQLSKRWDIILVQKTQLHRPDFFFK